jgi:hypothetical protein
MRAVLCLLLATGVAHAEPVNLLTHTAAVINVGSTVANQAIKPEHLVDGKRDTAWNSQTNDLVGAWIIVRLPTDVKVESVKLTVGFTKVDPKLGDLFTENPRIKKVRVTHGKTVVDKELDITNRELQEIAIAGEGGDYRIEVREVEMGTKKTWREICISELEVWGTSPRPRRPTRPPVYVQSFEPPPLLSEADCKKWSDGNVSTSAYVLSDRYGVCETVDAASPNDPFDPMHHQFSLIALPEKQGLPKSVDIYTQVNEGLGEATDTRLTTSTVFVGDDVLWIAALGSATWNNLPGADLSTLPEPSTQFTVYRATPDGLIQVLEVKGTEACTFAEAAAAPRGKPGLDFTCGKTTKHFRFDGHAYVRR